MEFGARADSWDFRDAVYRPNLVEVPEEILPTRFLSYNVPVQNQGPTMACTGYSLATLANYLIRSRARAGGKDDLLDEVSPEMLYAMARRYDEYPGTSHNGSSVRGAMKGWHRHGVCSRKAWENESADGENFGASGVLTRARARDASTRPLGAYYRVDVRDLNAVHCALAEVGVMVAALRTHDGWFDLFHPAGEEQEPDSILASLMDVAASKSPVPAIGHAGAALRGVDPEAGFIPWPAPDSLGAGLHAVAVIGYDRDGVWIQNSQGRRWGRGGLARISYDDWMENASDGWVARLGAPVTLGITRARGSAGANQSAARDYAEMRPHLITIGVDGKLQEHGSFATTRSDISSILRDEFRVQTEAWKRRRLLIVASSGIYPMDGTIRTIAGLRDPFMQQEVYPLVLLWNAGFAERMTEILTRGWQSRQAPGSSRPPAESGDRLDESLETLCRRMGGWVEWDHVKRTAARTVEAQGALSVMLDQLDRAFRDADANKWPFEVHLVGESCAAWLLGHLLQKLATPREAGGFGHAVASMTLCAPACTTDFFKATMKPVLDAGQLDRFSLVTLRDAAERIDGFAGLYRGSLLNLISNGLEDRQRIPPDADGTPMLGLARHIEQDAELRTLFDAADVTASGARKVEHVMLDRGNFEGSGGQLHGRLLQGEGRVHGLLSRVLDAPEVGATEVSGDMEELVARAMDAADVDSDGGSL